jgi:sugar O-acyltransferase (sialic acid O-acetyltransferase NeuD family)
VSERLVIIGAGGFGRETLGVVDAINDAAAEPTFELLGVLDDSPSELNLARLAALGVRHLGTVADWLQGDASALFVVGIGSPAVRQSLADRFEDRGHRAATLVDPRAHVGRAGTVGEGSVICAGVEISTNVTIGRHVHINPHVTIGHDSTIGDGVSINPAATISGDVTVEDRVLIGAAAVVLQGLVVHTGSLVGAAACVVRDVPTGTTVKGVPAR